MCFACKLNRSSELLPHWQVLTNATLGLADIQQTLSAAAAVFIFNILYEVILSRSAKQYAMCPLIDFINHSSSVESEVSYDYFSDSFSVTASRSYQQEDQVFVNYGQNNDGLMQFYGFAEVGRNAHAALGENSRVYYDSLFSKFKFFCPCPPSQVDNAKDIYVMTSLLKWLDEVSPADQKRLSDLNSVGLLKSLQTVRKGYRALHVQYAFLLQIHTLCPCVTGHHSQVWLPRGDPPGPQVPPGSSSSGGITGPIIASILLCVARQPGARGQAGGCACPRLRA